MTAHFIDVGQGDAILLEFPCGAILIDTGAQDSAHVTYLLDYLSTIYKRRGDLANTLETVFITHDHPDHVKGLEEVITHFKVKRLIYNGKTKANEVGELCRVLRNKNKYGLAVEDVTFEKAIANGNRDGLTDSMIDPVQCDKCDPKITVLSGGFLKNPGWSVKQFANKNNHSLVIRVDFGKSSFLFTGDLEEDALNKVVAYYHPVDAAHPGLLDTDILKAGHHGSYNATNVDFLDAVTPQMAVISVGSWSFGKGSSNQFTTYAYGHPRKETLDLLSQIINKLRAKEVTIRAGIGPRKFVNYIVRKNIYATAWDKSVQVVASLDGNYTVLINN